MRSGEKMELRESVRAHCDEDGVEEVRNKLARSAYRGQKTGIVEEWLAEQLEAEREVKEATERQIDRQIARDANHRATIANVISVVALLVAVAAVLIQ